MPSEPVLFGAPYSVYVRIVRLVLAEKGIAYQLIPVDIFSEGGPPEDFRRRHPFGRIPSFEHEGFCLYETVAITRYLDEAFPGVQLQPFEPRRRARLNQLISILDSYAYRTLVWDIYVERVAKFRRGELSDEARIAAALPKAAICLSALSNIMDEGPFLCGSSITLADLHAAPMFAYFSLAQEFADLMEPHQRLLRWWRDLESRESMRVTADKDSA